MTISVITLQMTQKNSPCVADKYDIYKFVLSSLYYEIVRIFRQMSQLSTTAYEKVYLISHFVINVRFLQHWSSDITVPRTHLLMLLCRGRIWNFPGTRNTKIYMGYWEWSTWLNL